MATACKIDAMTLMGEFLKVAEKNKGTKGSGINQHTKKVRSTNGTAPQPPKLSDSGISKRESSDAQALATIKKKQPKLYEKVRAGKAR